MNRAHADEQVDPLRLIEAADAALKAATKVWQDRGGRRPYPAHLIGAADEPGYLREFTRLEIEAASEFLVRLGMIEKSDDQPLP